MSDVLLYGAYGHTGRFIVDELLRRGIRPILAGRDGASLERLATRHPELERRRADVDERQLRAAVADVAVVVNAAGPFLDTALGLARAASAAGAHYLDLAAEQAAVQSVYDAHEYEKWGDRSVVVPGLAFFGGLPDLLADSLRNGWDDIDSAVVAIGIDRWWPTPGTRLTGERNQVQRVVVRGGILAAVDPRPDGIEWMFPEPLAAHHLREIPFSEIITMHRHLPLRELRTYISSAAIDDISDAGTPGPAAIDPRGASAQRFCVEVVLRRGDEERSISASGRDIYFITAPLIAEAVTRLLAGRHRGGGALAPAQAFDAADLLESLVAADALTVIRRRSSE